MLDALHAAQPNEALASKLNLYGQFVGSWDLEIEFRALNGFKTRAPGEWHFSWVLDGKAVQDVWIFPRRSARPGGKASEPWHMYGSTFRWYDPMIDAWQIRYFDPSRALETRQLGRAVGNEIVQIGDDVGGTGLLRRWRFADITKDSFRWIGEASWDRGATWTLEMEMKATRTK